jgi:hypothetical protein
MCHEKSSEKKFKELKIIHKTILKNEKALTFSILLRKMLNDVSETLIKKANIILNFVQSIVRKFKNCYF